MKKFVTVWLPWILIAAMIAAMVPAVFCRVTNENKNKNVVVSLLYNDIRNKVSGEKLSAVLDDYRDAGVDMISVMEDDVNALVARGEITCIKYNVLCHKYEDESMAIAETIRENYPEVGYDAYLLMTKRENAKKKLETMVPLKYTKEDYVRIDDIPGMDIYAFFDGREDLWDMTLGYDEKVISDLTDKGFDITMVYKIKNYDTQAYVPYIRSLADRYNVTYFNIKEAADEYTEDEAIRENYTWIPDMINEKDMTLVVTENPDQLSNQKCFGYSYIFRKVMEKSKKVLRSFETYDDSQDDGSHYHYRANQFFNSTIDRNIRFITVTQIAPIEVTFDEGADFTVKAVSEYKKMIEKEGFTVNGKTNALDYTANRRLIGAFALVVMAMMVLLIVDILTGQKSFARTVVLLIAAVLGVGATAIMPLSLVRLYPSVYCIVLACFAMTLVMQFAKDYREKLPTLLLIFASLAIVLATLCIGVLAMGAMLSGMEYYINNEIFRGIKLSLIVPVGYTALAYCLIYMDKEKQLPQKEVVREKLIGALNAQIKVYWVIIAAFLGAVGLYYLRRSGNVNHISELEALMRETITRIFPARPRTKEFLIGYPSLVLFAYYVKNGRFKLIQWIFATGASILAASVVNSFCHVFTDLSVIYMRVVNGLLIGAVVSLFVYVANLVIVRIIGRIGKKAN